MPAAQTGFGPSVKCSIAAISSGTSPSADGTCAKVTKSVRRTPEQTPITPEGARQEHNSWKLVWREQQINENNEGVLMVCEVGVWVDWALCGSGEFENANTP